MLGAPLRDSSCCGSEEGFLFRFSFFSPFSFSLSLIVAVRVLLDSQKITYYKDQLDHKCLGTIELSHVRGVSHGQSNAPPKNFSRVGLSARMLKHGSCFLWQDLVFVVDVEEEKKVRDYVFCALNEVQKSEWTAALQEAISRFKPVTMTQVGMALPDSGEKWTHEGLLFKRGPTPKHPYKVRWVTLDRRMVRYYKEKGDKEELGSFELARVTTLWPKVCVAEPIMYITIFLSLARSFFLVSGQWSCSAKGGAARLGPFARLFNVCARRWHPRICVLRAQRAGKVRMDSAAGEKSGAVQTRRARVGKLDAEPAFRLRAKVSQGCVQGVAASAIGGVSASRLGQQADATSAPGIFSDGPPWRGSVCATAIY